ncbi:hypothetical protein GCM10007047_18110 [Cerasicoccus arenae]|uniref:Uncharacterized protein n=3 Tax=Cerasicoccus arenae TaxID=424488 RepID=A0A8J3GEX4_9BACT|nr:hypothetical protein GCM10007047_18110 [Cerasicoccus arenae]
MEICRYEGGKVTKIMPSEETFLFDDPAHRPAALEKCTVSNAATTSQFEQIEDRLLRQDAVRRTAVIKRIDELGLPEPGEQYRLVTMRTFSAVEFIDYIANREPVLECAIVLYSISRLNAAKIRSLLRRRRIQRAMILVSSLRNTAAQEKEDVAMTVLKGTPGVDMFFASSHAKIFTCETAEGNFYSLEGSGNLANNSRIEQYCLDNSEPLYHFHREWLEEVKGVSEGRGL